MIAYVAKGHIVIFRDDPGAVDEALFFDSPGTVGESLHQHILIL